MLAGCSFTSRHQMSTAQRFDILPCGFSKRRGGDGGGGGGGAPRAAGDARSGSTTCSFRTHPAPPVTQGLAWGAKTEPGGNAGDVVWERNRAVKRSHEEDAAVDEEEYGPVVRAKRTRMGGDGDEVWFHQSIAGTMQVAAGGGGEEAEEEKVFLVPSAAAFPHGMAAAAAGTSLAAAKKEEYSKSPSNSSSSSGTDGGSSAAMVLPEASSARNGGVPASSSQREALELVGALTACADSLAAGNHDATNYYLARLGEMASPSGPTPVHRVAAYFAEALAIRVVRLWPHVFDVSPPRELTDDAFNDDDATALRVLNAVTPIPRFLHFTLNERLLRAFEGHERVHVIDFDIKQGLQWPGLLQSLASRRPAPPAHVRITGVGESRAELQETGARLARVAAALGLPFEFHTVVDRLEDVRLWMLHVKRGECVAVNCVLAMHRLLRDETGGSLADFLGLARSTGAAILLLAEHEGGGLNAGRWEARFARALRYYAAAFDAVGAAGLADASPARAKAEEMFAREIRNAVAFEGGDRFERHECFAWWRRRMEDGGFRNAGIGDREAMQGRMIARMFADGRYSVAQAAAAQGEGLTLRWLDQPLYTVTAWAPAGDGITVSASTTASHSQQS